MLRPRDELIEAFRGGGYIVDDQKVVTLMVKMLLLFGSIIAIGPLLYWWTLYH